jgi:arylsulfatase A-like enzyme
LSADEQRLFSRMAEVYAGYISYTDDQLGRVLDYLEESGQLDDTLVVVVSDNGGSGEGAPTAPSTNGASLTGSRTPPR